MLEMWGGHTHFSIRGSVHSLIHSHVELRVKHVLDEAAKLHQTVGLQVMQGNVVERRNLVQKRTRSEPDGR